MIVDMSARKSLKILVCLFSLTSATFGVVLNDSNDPMVLMRQICRNDQVTLKDVQQVMRLIIYLEASGKTPENCPYMAIKSLIDLKPLVSSGLEDLCSYKKVNQIKTFYKKFIKQQSKGDKFRTPNAVTNFFLAFVFRISSICKNRLLDASPGDPLNYINHLNKPKLENWISCDTSNRSIRDRLFGQTSSYDELLLAGAQSRLIIDNEGQKDVEQIYLRTSAARSIWALQTVCDDKLKPLYDELLEPLIHLSVMGFNSEKASKPTECKHCCRWFKLMYLCESLSNLIAIDIPQENSPRLKGKDRRKVYIPMSEIDALKLIEKEPALVEYKRERSDDFEYLLEKQRKKDSTAGFEYASLPKDIISQNDTDLLPAIKSYPMKMKQFDFRKQILDIIAKGLLD